MSDLPFQELLDELARDGLRVTIREHVALARLLQRYDGTSRAEFRTAVAALLGRSLPDVRKIESAFDRLYPDAYEPPPPPRLTPPPKRTWPRWVLAGVAITIAIGFTTVALWPADTLRGHLTDPPPKYRFKQDCAAIATPSRTETTTHWGFVALGLVAAGAVLAFSSVARGRKRVRRWNHDVSRTRAEGIPGARTYRIAVPDVPRTESKAYPALALALMRAAQDWARSHDLDVARTLRDSTRSYPRVSLVQRMRRTTSTIVLLEDTASDMRPWRRKIDALVTGLQRSGASVVRLYFAGDMSRVARTRDGKRSALSRAQREYPGSPLVVISWSARTQLDRGWPCILRLTPVADVNLWPHAVRRDGAYAITHAGLLAAASAIANRSDEPPPLLHVPGVKARDAQLFAALLQLVPSSTFELAELVRVRLFPDAPEELLLSARTIVDGTRTDSPHALLRALDPGRAFELRLRSLMVSILDASEPAPHTAAHLRWRRDRAIQRAALGLAGAVEELQALATAPIADELLLHVEASSLDVLPQLRREVEANVKTTVGGPSTLARPHLFAFVLAAAVAAPFFARIDVEHEQQIPQRLSYKLQEASPVTVPPRYEVVPVAWFNGPPETDIAVYRDGVQERVVGTYEVFDVEPAAEGSCYQVASISGNYQHTSNVLFVPPPLVLFVPPPVDPRDKPPPPDGAKLVADNCLSCHSLDGKAGIGPTFAGIGNRISRLADGTTVTVDATYIRQKILRPKATQLDGFPATSPSFEGRFSDAELSAIAAYMMSLPATTEQGPPPLAVTNVTPATVTVGDRVTITGTGFTTVPRTARVTIGGVAAELERFDGNTRMIVRTSNDAPPGAAAIVVDFDPGGRFSLKKRLTLRAAPVAALPPPPTSCERRCVGGQLVLESPSIYNIVATRMKKVDKRFVINRDGKIELLNPALEPDATVRGPVKLVACSGDFDDEPRCDRSRCSTTNGGLTLQSGANSITLLFECVPDAGAGAPPK